MTDELWTIEQLPDRVAEALAENYAGQQNGRVRELPNGRTIRWYTTIGLVDRPAATRGRNALYNRRHVLQLAAVKRLQAAGRSLAEIQEELLGATDRRLADVAQVRLDVALPPAQKVSVEPFWNRRPHDDSVNKLVYGVRVADSVTVVLDAATRTPDAAEVAEIEAAAAPLLDVLDRLGLSPRKEDR
jgi:DNA-binding transcriptional MerR regulator